MDAIARRANINKRMLYHYFGDKEGLFKAVLSRKITERQSWAEALSGEPEETLPFWFRAACQDSDWVRLFQWEALQEQLAKRHQRNRAAGIRPERGLKRIRQRQARGLISAGLDPRHVMLCHAFAHDVPGGLPQLTRLITRKIGL